MKRYMPVTYIDENGVIHDKEKIKNKMYKIVDRKSSIEYANDNIYVYTTNIIRITEQKNLFENGN